MITLPPAVPFNFNPYPKATQLSFSKPRYRILPASKGQPLASKTLPQDQCLPSALPLADSLRYPQISENVPPPSKVQSDSPKLYLDRAPPVKLARPTHSRWYRNQTSLSCGTLKRNTAQTIEDSPHLKSCFDNATPTRTKPHLGLTCLRVSPIQSDMIASMTEFDTSSPEPFPTLTEDDSHSGATDGGYTTCEHAKLKSGDDAEYHAIADQHWHRHHQRTSNASSANVHTMKTASMTNISISIAPQSLRLGRLSESRSQHQTYPRHSLDGDGPSTRSPIDDAALYRAVKRRDIINELIMTEESYVADLKALGHLYSTLLVSTTAMSDHVRRPVLRNVTELLHVHESLLEQLHQTSFNAAARQWTCAESTPCSQISRRTYRTKTTAGKRSEMYAKHRRYRSSIGSEGFVQAYSATRIAEPADMIDFAEVLGLLAEQLPVYEEYCASYRTVARELRSHGSSLWATYESGMESLNKSIVAINKRRDQQRKGLTVGDLLIKPIQRVCRYPLLLADLVKNTPVIDGPAAHKALDALSDRLCSVVQKINLATDDVELHAQTQRKWLLFDRLILPKMAFSSEEFHRLGSIQLCGVLHVAYQNKSSDIRGCFAVCVLFEHHFLIALPITKSSNLELLAVITMSTSGVQCTTIKSGLRCLSAPFTWKVVFSADGNQHEVLLSACSEEEESKWKQGLCGLLKFKDSVQTNSNSQSRIMKDFLPLHSALDSSGASPQQSFEPFTSRYSRPRHETYAVVIRNTFNPQEAYEAFPGLVPLVVGKSQPQAGVRRSAVLAPKRVERARLEFAISDIYTKDQLPFPGMNVSSGSHLIRASAGSLARKLSFASMQASFSRRSASLSSKRSYHTIHAVPQSAPTFSVMKPTLDRCSPARPCRLKELPELDTMDSVVERMIGTDTARNRLSVSGGEKLVRKSTKDTQSRHVSSHQIGPNDLATIFYSKNHCPGSNEPPDENYSLEGERYHVEKGLSGLSRRKRWSNPIMKLRNIGSDGLKMMLYSSN